LSLPQQAVQAAHAAHEAGIYLAAKTENVSNLILLAVANEAELLAHSARLQAAGILFTLFTEPDLDGAATALATAPLLAIFKPHFKSLKLWGAPASCIQGNTSC
jgi:hypothetical protein